MRKVPWENSEPRSIHLLAITIFFISIIVSASAFGQPASYNEAPALAERVAAGELPPVEARLPENPLVVPVIERIGQYGGDWNSGMLGVADANWIDRTIGYEDLLRWDPEWTELIPNIAESYEFNEEGTEYVFHLREGMKWSDGQPFTADDIMFWYEDVFLNDEFTPVKSAFLVSGDEPVVVEKLDDYTIKFTFAAPNGLFLQRIPAQRGGLAPTRYPRHYLEQFHPSYNPEGIDSLVQEAGLDEWTSLFANQANWHRNPDLPTLHAWVVTTPLAEGTRVVAERNPYYWKVDPEGNQLPYLDQVVYDLVDNVEVLLLKAMSGEIDMQDRNINIIQNRAVLFDNMDRGNYRFFEAVPSDMNVAIISFNLTHSDPVKREIFQNKDFRIGLSHAINRQEIIDLVYVGQGEPYQAAPRPETPFYHEQLAKQYTEYDVDLANEYLDRAGYAERDAQGYRLGPDGQRISFVLELTDAHGLSWPDVIELVHGYWQAVGIDMQFRVVDRSLLDVRRQANEPDAMVWRGFGGGPDAILDPRWYFPFNNESNQAQLWRFWYQGDPRGEEPPEIVKHQMELYDQLAATPDPGRQVELMKEILEISADLFHVIGISLRPVGFGIVKNDFHNVPASMPFATEYQTPSPTNPSQYFKTSE